MEISTFISKIESPRKELMTSIHNLILKTNKQVKPEIEKMMGVEMIVYKQSGLFTYGLSSVKSHMSLHAMPIYMNPPLHGKYSKLLNKAKFQKGCVNFKSAEEMPLDVVKNLLSDCSKVDLIGIMEKHRAKKK